MTAQKPYQYRREKTLLVFVSLLWALLTPPSLHACSCAWKGPFLAAAQDAPLVVIGTVLRHHPGAAPTMDVLVLETLKGGILDSGLIIQMGDGMYCRPTLDRFPVGTQWVLALNGQGAKPGNGWAVSHCGEYWLGVDGGYVIGSIDGDMHQIKRMPLQEFKKRFLYPRFSETFSGSVEAGNQFRRAFGPRFAFVLEPVSTGWLVMVREHGREENLARLTPPLHFAPNPCEIEGWHFLKNPAVCANRPYQADAGPENPRVFIFSPEVGTTIAGPDSRSAPSEADVEAVRAFGTGRMDIGNIKLMSGDSGCPKIQRMEFSVRLDGGY